MSLVPNKAEIEKDLRRARARHDAFRIKMDNAMMQIEKLEVKQPMDKEDEGFNSAIKMCLEILSEVK